MKKICFYILNYSPYVLLLCLITNITRYAIWQYFNKCGVGGNFFEHRKNEVYLYIIYFISYFSCFLYWYMMAPWVIALIMKKIKFDKTIIVKQASVFVYLFCFFFMLYLEFVDQFFLNSF